MKQKLKRLALWLGVFNFALFAFLGMGIGVSKAQVLPVPATPTVQFNETSGSAPESISSQSVAVCLYNEQTMQDVNVGYTVSGTAENPTDYTSLQNGQVNILAGQTCGEIDLTLVNHGIAQANKTIVFRLTSVSSGNGDTELGDNYIFTFTIIDAAPVTTLITTPANSNAQGWFTTAPQISLTSDIQSAVIKYSWDNGISWKIFDNSQPVVAPEGNSVLEYYAVAFGKTEPIQSHTFKVDTTNLAVPTISSTINSQGNVQLSWLVDSSVYEYQVWRSGVLLATLPAGSTLYSDKSLVNNQTYNYYLVAINQAGRTAQSQTISVMVSVTEVVVTVPEVVVTAPVMHTAPKHRSHPKNIIAASTVKQAAPVVIQVPDNTVKVTNTNSQTEPITVDSSKTHDWNKILLIISLILIISGIVIGVYYGYEWYGSRQKDSSQGEPRSKSRW